MPTVAELEQIEAASRDLYDEIKRRDYTFVEELEEGDYFLFQMSVARFDGYDDEFMYLTRLNPDGSDGREYELPRFEGQRVQVVTEDELNEAIALAEAAGGGFKPREIFGEEFYEAVGEAIEEQERMSR